VGASLQRSFLWPKIKVLHLTENMRVDRNDPQSARFAEWLQNVGQGKDLPLDHTFSIPLFRYESVSDHNFPVSCEQRHIWTECQGPSHLEKNFVQEKEAKVIDLIILWILHIVVWFEADALDHHICTV
jgi:PIF1-like helicase